MIDLNSQQLAALSKIQAFLHNEKLDVFILRGSAGTGKTTLIAKLVQHLEEIKYSYAVLAPTGRAARIIGAKIKQTTGLHIDGSTVHRVLYQLDDIMSNDSEVLSESDPALRFYYPLKTDESAANLLIIDESSMIGDKENVADFIQFGSGRLLKDIIEFCRMARLNRSNDHLTKILFVGDAAQLPPVGEDFSPALSEQYLLQTYNIKSEFFDLTQVMRQAADSKILDEATKIRNSIINEKFNNFDLIINNQDIFSYSQDRSLDWMVESLKERKSSIAITYSNAAALGYNRSIRENLYGSADCAMQVGDILLVNKNASLHSLSNGDLVKVLEVGSGEVRTITLKVKNESNGQITNQLVNLSFREATVAYRSIIGNIQVSCFILENLLNSPNRDLSPLEIRALYVDFLIRNPEAKKSSERKKELLKKDPYFNALQVKYGYAVTCHKAQGGEWQSVLVDFYGFKGMQNKGFFQWAYTAITRASESLIVLNQPKFTALSTINWGCFANNLEMGQNETVLNSPTQDSSKIDKIRESYPSTVIPQPLEAVHSALVESWHKMGFAVVHLEHLQYCERYTLLCKDRNIQVQYYYNAKFQISRYEIVANQQIEKVLSERILSAFDNISTLKKNNDGQFIEDFLQMLDLILDNSPIKKVSFRVMPYRLRILFSDNSRQGEIDFNFNGKQNWTTVQEVGGIGATKGLFQEIAILMKNHEEGK